MSTGDPHFDKVTELCNTAVETANKAIDERDRLAAINAELAAALKNMVALVDHFKEYPKCKASKFFFGRGEHSDIEAARAALERATA